MSGEYVWMVTYLADIQYFIWSRVTVCVNVYVRDQHLEVGSVLARVGSRD